MNGGHEMFITIEGIDGSGKTSVSKIIASQLGFEYRSQKSLSTYMEIENDLYLKYCNNYRKNTNCDLDSMFMLYSLSCYLSGCGENVICDRHLPTVYFWYGNDNNICIADLIYKMTKKPDITIILNVSVDTAMERIKQKRLKNEISDYIYQRDLEKAKRAGDFVSKTRMFLHYFDLKYFIIDADKKSLSEIVDEITYLMN